MALKIEDLFAAKTPVEEHDIGGHCVWVKRDDKFGRPPAPPQAKCRGLCALIEGNAGIQGMACWDTRVSTLGIGVAALCRAMGIKAMIGYPFTAKMIKEGRIPEPAAYAQALGAEIVQCPATRLTISQAFLSRAACARGFQIIPAGLACPEGFSAARQAGRELPEYVLGGTLVMVAGSGIISSGVLAAHMDDFKKVCLITIGRPPSAVARRIAQNIGRIAPYVSIQAYPKLGYYDPLDIPVPFPAHPHYDMKSWHWLQMEIERGTRFPEPILFWNIGGYLPEGGVYRGND